MSGEQQGLGREQPCGDPSGQTFEQVVGGGACPMERPGKRAVARSCPTYAPARAVSGGHCQAEGLAAVGRRSHSRPLRLPDCRCGPSRRATGWSCPAQVDRRGTIGRRSIQDAMVGLFV